MDLEAIKILKIKLYNKIMYSNEVIPEYENCWDETCEILRIGKLRCKVDRILCFVGLRVYEVDENGNSVGDSISFTYFGFALSRRIKALFKQKVIGEKEMIAIKFDELI